MFQKYYNLIANLTDFEKSDILNDYFKLYEKDKITIFYAPHNEVINRQAKVLIVGITPGWTQTNIAYKTAHDGIIKGLDNIQIQILCKKESRFAGSMRKNLIEMLDEIKLNDKLKIKSCSQLFGDKEELLHTTSVIPYPVFINNKNYTGHNPELLKSEVLMSYVRKYFYKEVKQLKDILIIPLGNSVENVLKKMIDEKIITKEQCLFGFPHPSGANGHRKKQFYENKENLIAILDYHFKKNY